MSKYGENYPRLVEELRAELAAERERAKNWKADIEKIADVVDPMWREQYIEAEADWIIADITLMFTASCSENDAVLDETKGDGDA